MDLDQIFRLLPDDYVPQELSFEQKIALGTSWNMIYRLEAQTDEEKKIQFDRLIELAARDMLIPGSMDEMQKPSVTINPKSYKPYLYDNEDRNPSDFLITRHSKGDMTNTIVRAEGRGYAFANPALMDIGADTIHECVRGHCPQRLSIDLDASREVMNANKLTDLDVVISLLHAVIEVIYKHCEAHYSEDKIKILHDLAVAISPPFDEQFSLHLVFPRFVLATHHEVRAWLKQVAELMGPVCGNFIDFIPKELYSLRVLNAHKYDGTRLKLPTRWSLDHRQTSRYDYLVQPPKMEWEERGILPAMYTSENDAMDYGMYVVTTTLEQKEIDQIVKCVEELNEGLEIREVDRSMVKFNRKLGVYFCKACGRHHGSLCKPGDGGFAWKLKNGAIFYKCRRQPDDSKARCVKHSDYKPPSMWERLRNRIQSSTTIPLIAEAKEIKADLVVCLDADEMIESTDVFPPLTQKEKSNTLGIANMGTGKTKLCIRDIERLYKKDKNYCGYFIMYRRALSREMETKLKNVCAPLGVKVVNYEDVEGQLKRTPGTIYLVQAESMWRINLASSCCPIFTIVDEVDGVMRQSRNTKSVNIKNAPGTIATILQDLLRASHHRLYLDAFADNTTIAWLNCFGLDTPLRVVVNTYKPRVSNIIQVAPLNNVIEMMFEALDDNKNIAVACTTKDGLKGAKTLESAISEKYPDLKVKSYHADTAESVKQEDFANIEEVWSKHNVILYSPTIESGISFEKNHFHTVFALVDFAIPIHIETICQMTRRIRNTDEMIIGIANSFSFMPLRSPLREDIKDDATFLTELVMGYEGMRRFNQTTNKYELPKTLETMTFIEVEHSKRMSQMYAPELLKVCLETDGSKIRIVEPRENTDKFAQIKTLLNDSKGRICEEEYDAIFATPTCSEVRAKEIEEKACPTMEEQLALKRYRLLRGLNMLDRPTITREWITKWAAIQHRLHFSNFVTTRKGGYNYLDAIKNIENEDFKNLEHLQVWVALMEANGDEKNLNKEVAKVINTKPKSILLTATSICLNLFGFFSPEDQTEISGVIVNQNVKEFADLFIILSRLRPFVGLRETVNITQINTRTAADIANTYLTHTYGYKIITEQDGKRVNNKRKYKYKINRRTVPTPNGGYTGFDIDDAPRIPDYNQPAPQTEWIYQDELPDIIGDPTDEEKSQLMEENITRFGAKFGTIIKQKTKRMKKTKADHKKEYANREVQEWMNHLYS